MKPFSECFKIYEKVVEHLDVRLGATKEECVYNTMLYAKRTNQTVEFIVEDIHYMIDPNGQIQSQDSKKREFWLQGGLLG